MGRIGCPETSVGLLDPKMGRIGFPETSLGLLDPENVTDRLSRNVSWTA